MLMNLYKHSNEYGSGLEDISYKWSVTVLNKLHRVRATGDVKCFLLF